MNIRRIASVKEGNGEGRGGVWDSCVACMGLRLDVRELGLFVWVGGWVSEWNVLWRAKGGEEKGFMYKVGKQ